jgi:hypothetical protein
MINRSNWIGKGNKGWKNWKDRGESIEEWKKSIGLPGTILIHAHHCTHDLIRSYTTPMTHCEYNGILELYKIELNHECNDVHVSI